MQLTVFQKHVKEWHNCQRCDLAKTRQKVVLARGNIPCDVLLIGEGPGECITGDTLIETAFRDKGLFPNGVPIEDLEGQSSFYVYSYDLDNKCLTLGKVLRVWTTGVRQVFRVTYQWWGAPLNGGGGRELYTQSIRVTDNHPFLLKSGSYMSISEGLEIGQQLLPFYRFCSRRRHRVGAHSTSMAKEAVFLMEHKIGRTIEEGEQCHHRDRNPSNDEWNNLELLDIREHARLHGFEDNAMHNPVHRETHRQVMQSVEYREMMSRKMKAVLANPQKRKERLEQINRQREHTAATVKKKFATDPVYYYNFLKGRRRRDHEDNESLIRKKVLARFPDFVFPDMDNHRIIKIEKDKICSVYDMEVEKYNNFSANGIFVHNSENVLGRPFCGPAGKLLDVIIYNSLRDKYTYCISNMVACIPRDEDGKATEPSMESIEACAPRLQALVKMCVPKLIVCVGATARDFLDQKYSHGVKLPRIPMIDITHPSAILRATVVQRGLMTQRVIVKIITKLESLDDV